jgi:environmental stress-induced protein Ves
MPWKNGGGVTTEIAAHPAGAGLDAIDWRLSLAEVAVDGPFSRFPGIDRTLVLLDGAGMRLESDGHAVELRAPYEPYDFSGDVEVDCRLLAGPVRDFNLMLRRGCVRGGLTVLRDGGARIHASAERFCFVAAGAVECRLPGGTPVAVAAGHALWIGGRGPDARSALAVDPLTAGAVTLVASIDRA